MTKMSGYDIGVIAKNIVLTTFAKRHVIVFSHMTETSMKVFSKIFWHGSCNALALPCRLPRSPGPSLVGQVGGPAPSLPAGPLGVPGQPPANVARLRPGSRGRQPPGQFPILRRRIFQLGQPGFPLENALIQKSSFPACNVCVLCAASKDRAKPPLFPGQQRVMHRCADPSREIRSTNSVSGVGHRR